MNWGTERNCCLKFQTSLERNVFVVNLLGKQVIAFGQTSDAIIWFAHHTDGTADGINFWCASHGSGLWIDFSHIQLDWSMVFSMDDSVTGWAVNEQTHWTIIAKKYIDICIRMLEAVYRFFGKHDMVKCWGYVRIGAISFHLSEGILLFFFELREICSFNLDLNKKNYSELTLDCTFR